VALENHGVSAYSRCLEGGYSMWVKQEGGRDDDDDDDGENNMSERGSKEIT